jgi:Cu(I)/Ag(I) efflux system membrane fusion protein/cobalt-zinc-cadmium efflux system membrane fusion protein
MVRKVKNKMKISIKLAMAIVISIAGLTGILTASIDQIPGIFFEANAAESDLKAGMVDPKTGKKIKYWAAPMDPTYIRNEPGQSPMGMDLVPVYEDEGGEKDPTSTIRIDPVTVQNMGVRLGTATRKSLTKYIRTVGTVTYNETRLYIANSKFNGWIEKLYVNFVGEPVQKGQPLFEIYSPEVLTAQQEYLLAYSQFKNQGQNASTSAKNAAKRMVTASRNRLLYWDLDESHIKKLERTGEIQKTVTVYSPASGVVIKKNAFQGHYVKAGMHQYEIADLSSVWVDVDVYEYELPWIRKGMPAEMELAYIPGKTFKGEVLFVYPYLDTKTRTAKLRLSFQNDGLELKPGMYANINLQAEGTDETVVIPQEAVIDSGVRKVVFVALEKGRFQPREITVGIEGNDYEIQVLEGLSAGERIVLSGQFLLDSESRLREAIQKMLEARNQPMDTEADELDMSDITMEMDAGSSQSEMK